VQPSHPPAPHDADGKSIFQRRGRRVAFGFVHRGGM
jgi:hypothetical protein